HFGKIAGLTVAILGDVLHSRVARSNVHLLTKLGAQVRISGPRTLLADGIEHLADGNAGTATVYTSIQEAVTEADAIMMLRIQRERQNSAFLPTLGEYFKFYGLNQTRLQLARPNAIVLHPGPINRNVEIASEIADSVQSKILEQVQNGVAVRMAVLEKLLHS
ncbi:MAG TPA: aspartate carbamoyltransferase, partial [Acidobacteriota bacterium]|nr:aspartate carbamoyltransferase [Acidobacteriota bacterium]